MCENFSGGHNAVSVLNCQTAECIYNHGNYQENPSWQSILQNNSLWHLNEKALMKHKWKVPD